MKYTAEKRSTTRTGTASLGWQLGCGYVQESLNIKYEAWFVVNEDGKAVCECRGRAAAVTIAAKLSRAE